MKKLLTILLLSCVFAKGQTFAYTSQLIDWTGLKSCTYIPSTHTLTNNDTSNGQWENTAQTAISYPRNGRTGEWLRMTIPIISTTKQLMWGLAIAPLTTVQNNFNSMTYGVYSDGVNIQFIAHSDDLGTGSTFNGAMNTPTGNVQVDIVVTNNIVTAYVNNTLAYTWSRQVNEPLYGVADMVTNGGYATPTIVNAAMSSFVQTTTTTTTPTVPTISVLKPIRSSPSGSPIHVVLNWLPITVPTIILVTQPQAQTVAAGATATFSVSAISGYALSYQWKVNGTNISGATSASYSKTTTGDDNGDIYTVAVSANSMTVISNSALLTVTGGGSTTANFSFTLPQTAMTSAGLYKGDTLITTLWSLQPYSAGTHDTLVTGLDENNNQIPNGNYKVKVLSNNVNFADTGTFMNSSKSFHGYQTWRGGPDVLSNMTFRGKYGYVGAGYVEANYPRFKFNTDSIYQKSLISGQESYTYSGFNASDGNLVYWVTRSSNQNLTGRVMNFIFATDSLENEHTFTYGQPFNSGAGNPHISVVDTLGDLTNKTPRDCYGFTVQKTGNYMFTVRGTGIYVTNKNGQHVTTVNITDGGQMKVDQSNDTTAWLIEGSSVKRYKINSDGTLTYSGINITSMVAPLALDISPIDNTLKVIDAGTQQVWFFNKANGAFIRTLGRQNGYYGNVVVSDTAFMFTNDFMGYPQFITHQLDGTFWVCDNGNNRYQHFNAAGTYLNNIHFLDRTYTLYGDESDSTAIYYKATMAKVDITAANPQLGSYPAKNYLARMKPVYGSNGFFDVFNINGHKFSTLPIANSDQQLVELKDTGLRYTGIILSSLGGSGEQQFANNGDLLENTATYSGGQVTSWYWAIKTCTGLDGNGNPTFASTFTTTASVGPSTNQPIGGNLRAKLSDGTQIGFNNHGQASGYHLGGIKQGGTSCLWLDQPSTFPSYAGDFPKDYFDIGNAVSDYAGGTAAIKDDIIYTNYHGENWKFQQTNMINVYHKNGLEIAQFGVTGPRAEDGDAPYWLTGNSSHIVVLRKGADHLIVENDESKSGGMMVSQASNLSSIHIDSFNVAINGLTTIPANTTTDLLAGFPFNSTLTSGEQGTWTFSNGNYTNGNHSWALVTNRGTYARNTSPDVYMSNYGDSNFAKTTLPYTEGNNWQISQNIQLPDVANGMFNPSSYFYYRIKDAAGKVIVQVSVENQPFGNYGAPHAIVANGHILYTDSSLTANVVNIPYMHYLSIVRTGNNVTFSYIVNNVNYTATTPIYDMTADAGQPITLSLEHYPGGSGGTVVDIGNLKFNSNKQ